MTAIYSILYEPALAAAPDGHSTLAQNSQRFMKLNQQGKPFSESSKDQTWSCVLDKQTGLIWEIKSNNGDIQDAQQTYSWYETNPALNGGFAGYENKGKCVLSLCNTQAYITAINQKRICGSAQWRLPTREELRSIVDYKIKYPGPTINRVYFPNAINQFYWSSVPNANDKDSAWGIGFSFGYDYAYFKSDLGYIRLVSEHNK
ncbi:Lcl C-terminal domain-containing protein [Kaarinaea lacus]